MAEEPAEVHYLQVAMDPKSGEVLHSVEGHAPGKVCPGCVERDDRLAALETEKRGWITRYQTLKRDKDAEARDHKLWPQALEVFKYWRVQCNHPRSRFEEDRFWIIEKYLRLYGVDACKRAIDGAAFDPYVTTQKNGAKKRHDDVGLIFRDPDKFEGFCNRAPRNPAPQLPVE